MRFDHAKKPGVAKWLIPPPQRVGDGSNPSTGPHEFIRTGNIKSSHQNNTRNNNPYNTGYFGRVKEKKDMKVEIIDRFSTENKKHIKISCANGDVIRLEIDEFNDFGSTENKITVNCIETTPTITPVAANKIVINFKP